MKNRRLRPAAAIAASTVLVAATAATTLSAEAAPPAACDGRVNNTTAKLLECVDVSGVRAHQAALQQIADDNNGIRTSGTPGYDASAEYVADTMRAAGWKVTTQDFQFQTFITLSETVLEQVSPAPGGPVENIIMEYSGSGDVTAPVSSPAGILGCTAADWAGFTPGTSRWSRAAPAHSGSRRPTPTLRGRPGSSSTTTSPATSTALWAAPSPSTSPRPGCRRLSASSSPPLPDWRCTSRPTRSAASPRPRTCSPNCRARTRTTS